MQLADLYADFTAVLRTTEPGRAVLDNVLLPFNSGEIDVADVLSAPCDTSLAAKLEAGAYNLPEPFFHDLKLAFGRLIAQFPQNASEYEELAQLFKFASDLLVREANRMGFTKLVNLEDDEYLFRLSQGFQRISTELQDYNSETFWVTAAAGPLFMSVTNKAPFDPRDTAVAGSVHTVKLMPHVARAPESTIGIVSPLNPLMPQPYATPSDMLSRFVHPNVHSTIPPMWLTGTDSYSSFAPSIDSAGAVIGGADATQVWLEKAGLTADEASDASTANPTANSTAQASANSAAAQTNSNTPTEAANTTTKDETEDQTNGHTPQTDDNNDPRPENGIQKPSMNGGDSLATKTPLSPAELEAILRWSPYNFVDDDEIEARKTDKEVELVSRLLLELQSLQRERLATSDDPRDIGDKERHIALKISNILARLVDESTSDSVKLNLDMRLPVLMRNYTGTLPAATDPALQQVVQQRNNYNGPQNSMRLHTLAGLRARTRTSGRR